jgi:peptidoglycan hydrolase CwlO-like protein
MILKVDCSFKIMEETVIEYLEESIRELVNEINTLTKKISSLKEEIEEHKQENKALKDIIDTYKEWDHI